MIIPNIKDMPEFVMPKGFFNAILMDEKGFVKFTKVDPSRNIPQKIGVPIQPINYQYDEVYGRVPTFSEQRFYFFGNFNGWLVYKWRKENK